LFLVENGTIRAIPNADTFAALKVRMTKRTGGKKVFSSRISKAV
jgi:hypothetical protein